jgi:hypothetical protein
VSSRTCGRALVVLGTSVARRSGQKLGERSAIDLQRDLTAGRGREIEPRAMEALIKKAEAVTVEPQDLQARSSSPTEHEDRAAFYRVSPNALASELREAIEAEPHVDRLDTKEHANA